MKLAEVELVAGNHFIAMQYYGLILNRTYLVLAVNHHLVGLVANGPVSEKNDHDPLTHLITTSLAVKGDLNNPFSYLNEKYLAKARNLDLLADDLSQANRANFRIGFEEITSVEFDPSKKWGMGNYPHSGKLHIGVRGRKREFILLGKQSGPFLADNIRQSLSGAGNPLKQGTL